jgi:hypothetical protein
MTGFCNLERETSVTGTVASTSHQECEGFEGAVKIYAFHCPTCHASSVQRPVLDQLEAEFPEAVEVVYICTPLSEEDEERCGYGIQTGEYFE